MLSLPPMSEPIKGEKYRIVPHRYYNIGSRDLLVVPKHYILRDGVILVSRTDIDGIILHANPTFIATTGYEEHELIGSSHNIIRHPDMPRRIFTDLWKTILNGQEWRGIFKNLRKDGGYYWVQTTIQPLFQNGEPSSFTSISRKTDRDTIKRTEAFYAEMLQDENPHSS